MKKFSFLFILLLCAFKVHDGDTFTDNAGQQVRLFGADAPEMPNNYLHCGEQLCYRADGKTYRCALESKLYLEKLINGKKLECDRKGGSYSRIVEDCYIGQMSVSEEMIRAGWAVNEHRYSHHRFDQAEAEAKAAHRGIWQGAFEMPWDYRWMCRKPKPDLP